MSFQDTVFIHPTSIQLHTDGTPSKDFLSLDRLTLPSIRFLIAWIRAVLVQTDEIDHRDQNPSQQNRVHSNALQNISTLIARCQSILNFLFNHGGSTVHEWRFAL